jgi:hypothetical protein
VYIGIGRLKQKQKEDLYPYIQRGMSLILSLNFLESGHIKVTQMRRNYDFEIKGVSCIKDVGCISVIVSKLQFGHIIDILSVYLPIHRSQFKRHVEILIKIIGSFNHCYHLTILPSYHPYIINVIYIFVRIRVGMTGFV